MVERSIVRVLLSVVLRGTAVIVLAGLAGASLVRMAPGFEADEHLTDYRLSRETLTALRKERAMSGTPLRYYATYLSHIARGEAGRSIVFGTPVSELIRQRAGTTLETVFVGLAGGWLAALLSAVAAALSTRQGAAMSCTLASSALVSVPVTVVATFCALWELPPAIAIAAVVFPRVYAHASGQIRTVSSAPHVVAARARGVGPLRSLAFHVAPAALWPMIALAGVTLSIAFGAAIPIEALTDSPGIGQLAWRAALGRDLAVLVPVTLLLTTGVVAANGAAEVGSVLLRRGSV